MKRTPPDSGTGIGEGQVLIPESREVHFKVVVPSFNSIPWIKKTLASIEQQAYPHVEVCVVDDASTLKGQREVIDKFCERNQWKKVFKPENKGSLDSIVKGIKALDCKDEDIIVIVDGDDWLFDDQVLNRVGRAYQEENLFLTYGNYMTEPPSFVGNPEKLPDEVIKNKWYRRIPFVFGHLRTFKYLLWRHLKDNDLRDDNGEYFRAGGDVVFMWPLLEMAGSHFKALQDILYVYNIGTPLNDFKLVPDEVLHVRHLMEQRPIYATLPMCL